jgi:PAS domain S-box-containing protein
MESDLPGDNKPDSRALTKDTKVSHYVVLERVCVCETCEVYLAEDTELGRKATLSFLPFQNRSNDDAAAIFRSEVQTIASLDHSNIIHVYELGEYGGRPFAAMEFLRGRSVRDVIQKETPSLRQFLDVAVQICRGLSVAHEAGIVLHDLRPGAILIDAEDRVRLLGFRSAGSECVITAGRIDSEPDMTRFMSEEHVHGVQIDYHSNILSLGIIMYWMLTGRHPFRHEGGVEFIQKNMSETLPLVFDKEKLSERLQRIINRALDRNPESRYAQVNELLADLERERSEMECLEAEQRYRELRDNIPAGVYRSTPDGKLISANPALVKMLGYDSEEEMTGVSAVKFYVDPEKREILMKELRDKGSFTNFEVHILRKDGTQRWASTNMRVSLDDDGQIAYIDGTAEDITKRKEAEVALRESEARYRLLIDNAGYPITVFSSEGKLLLTNSVAARNLGGTPEDLIGKCLYDLLPGIADIIKERTRTVIETGEGLETEDIIELPTGNRWFWSNMQLARDADDNIIGIQVISHDITDRKQAEEDLRTTHERLNATLNALPDLLFEMDREGRILDFRAPQPELLFRPPEEFLGKTMDEVLPKEASDTIMASVKKASELGQDSGAIYSLEIGGEECWFEFSVAASGDPKAPNARLVALVRNITDRKRAEAEARTSYERIEHLVSSSSTVIYSCKVGGNWACTFITKNVEKAWGYKASEFLEPDFWVEHLHPDDRDRILSDLGELLRNGSHEHEYRFLLADGTYHWISDQDRLIYDDHGEPLECVGSCTDITERKRSEDELREKTEELKTEQEMLREKNIALRQVLEQIESSRQEYQRQLYQDVDTALAPFLSRLKKEAGSEGSNEFEELEATLNSILAKDIDEFNIHYGRLTARESEICGMIKSGMTSKEISDDLSLSLLTVLKHREKIRKKLGITNRGISLVTYLRMH